MGPTEGVVWGGILRGGNSPTASVHFCCSLSPYPGLWGSRDRGPAIRDHAQLEGVKRGHILRLGRGSPDRPMRGKKQPEPPEEELGEHWSRVCSRKTQGCSYRIRGMPGLAWEWTEPQTHKGRLLYGTKGQCRRGYVQVECCPLPHRNASDKKGKIWWTASGDCGLALWKRVHFFHVCILKPLLKLYFGLSCFGTYL